MRRKPSLFRLLVPIAAFFLLPKGVSSQLYAPLDQSWQAVAQGVWEKRADGAVTRRYRGVDGIASHIDAVENEIQELMKAPLPDRNLLRAYNHQLLSLRGLRASFPHAPLLQMGEIRQSLAGGAGSMRVSSLSAKSGNVDGPPCWFTYALYADAFPPIGGLPWVQGRGSSEYQLESFSMPHACTGYVGVDMVMSVGGGPGLGFDADDAGSSAYAYLEEDCYLRPCYFRITSHVSVPDAFFYDSLVYTATFP